MSNKYIQIHAEMKKLATPERKKTSLWLFQTGPGEYGEGDKFLGVSVVQVRQVYGQFKPLSLSVVRDLLDSEWHEERNLAVIAMGEQYKKSDHQGKKKLYNLYFEKISRFNNWDLVDMSASHVIGNWLAENGQSISVLRRLAKSKNLWERRIGIISTFAHIRNDSLEETLEISEILLEDKEDLMHKAVGWALREVGKRDMRFEDRFLKKHYKTMPRTMLRYAIEKFPEKKRLAYLKGKI